MADSAVEFATLLGGFAGHIERVWERYEASGPGKVDSALYDPIEQLARQLNALLDGSRPDDVDRVALGAAINQATELARRCATLPQGLCFVSGEAGLVPRRDQLDAFAAARATVRSAVARRSRA